MKKIIIFLFCILTTSAVFAEEQKYNALIVKLNNGTEHAFVLAEKPTLLIQDDKMYITGLIEVHYLRSEIAKCYFEEINLEDPRIPVGIDAVNEDNFTFSYLDGENIRISGLKNKTTVSVASLDGKIIGSQKSDGSGGVTISLGNHPKGIYIISVGVRSIKVQRK